MHTEGAEASVGGGGQYEMWSEQVALREVVGCVCVCPMKCPSWRVGFWPGVSLASA